MAPSLHGHSKGSAWGSCGAGHLWHCCLGAEAKACQSLGRPPILPRATGTSQGLPHLQGLYKLFSLPDIPFPFLCWANPYSPGITSCRNLLLTSLPSLRLRWVTLFHEHPGPKGHQAFISVPIICSPCLHSAGRISSAMDTVRLTYILFLFLLQLF